MPTANPEIDCIRTVALVGQAAAGKTTLVEALLCKAGAIGTQGSLERGTTVCDFDPLEKRAQHSLNSALVHFDHHGARIHLIDTPGYADFVGQSLSALEAVDTAAVVVNAQVGVEMMTSRMMEWAGKRNLCRMIIVNKIDAQGVDLPALVAQLQLQFGKECLPLNLPAAGGTEVVDCFFNPAASPGHEADFSSVEQAHRALVEQVVEVDPGFVERYLNEATSTRPSCTRPWSRRCAKAISSPSASSRHATAPVWASCSMCSRSYCPARPRATRRSSTKARALKPCRCTLSPMEAST